MNFFRKIIYKNMVLALFMSLTLPLQSQETIQEYCPCPQQCDACFKAPCAQPSSCCVSSGAGWAMGGAIILGAAAGAGAGYAAGHNRKCSDKISHAECGCKNCLCKKNKGEELCFSANVTFNIVSATNNPPTVTFFVTTPTGCGVIGASSVPFTGRSPNWSLATFRENVVKICDPCCGTYHFGWIINSDALITNFLPVSIFSPDVTFQNNTIALFGTEGELTGVSGSFNTIQDSVPFDFIPDCCIIKSCPNTQ